MSNERRAHERAPLHSRVELTPDGLVHWIEVDSRDISSGGFSFYSPVQLEVGESFRLGFRLTGGGGFSVAATVIWFQPEGTTRFIVGARFPTDLSQAEIRLLRRAP